VTERNLCFIAFAYDFTLMGGFQQANQKIQEMIGTRQCLLNTDGIDLSVVNMNTTNKQRKFI
jgi:hypothetical protein